MEISPSIVVPLGHGKFSRKPESILKTFALGSCLGLSFYDPYHRWGGLMHIALPESSTNPPKSQLLPYYFVDSALVTLVELAEKYQLNLAQCELKVAGGASINSLTMASQTANPHYNIGRRNIEALKIGLRNWDLKLKAYQVGGTISRNMSLSLSTGQVLVYNAKDRWEL